MKKNDLIRFKMRSIRINLSKKKKKNDSICAFNLFFENINISSFKNIGVFLSFDGELNTFPLIKYLWKNNKKTFLPVMDFKKNSIFFFPFSSSSIMKKNRFGILEPNINLYNDVLFPQERIEILIVPLVAFNSMGYRLGMGKGCYDRFLSNWKFKNIIPIGYAYSFQLSESFIVHSWDVQLFSIVTPEYYKLF